MARKLTRRQYTIIIRNSNLRRDRLAPLDIIRSKDELWFYKSYRMSELSFYYVLNKITPLLETRNVQMARLSSGSCLNIEVLLAATLRYLAGGSYIDIVDLYRLPPTCAHIYFWRVLTAINEAIDNIKIPQNTNEWRNLALGWDNKMTKSFGKCYLKGTVFAIDGIVIETKQPI